MVIESAPTRFLLETAPRGAHWLAISNLVGGVIFVSAAIYWADSVLNGRTAGSAMLAVPVVLFGVVNIARSVNAMIRHHRVELSAQGGSITTLPLRIRRPLRIEQLRVGFDQVVRGEADGLSGTRVPVVVVEDDRTCVRILEGARDEERRLARSEMNLWLAKYGHSIHR